MELEIFDYYYNQELKFYRVDDFFLCPVCGAPAYKSNPHSLWYGAEYFEGDFYDIQDASIKNIKSIRGNLKPGQMGPDIYDEQWPGCLVCQNDPFFESNEELYRARMAFLNQSYYQQWQIQKAYYSKMHIEYLDEPIEFSVWKNLSLMGFKITRQMVKDRCPHAVYAALGEHWALAEEIIYDKPSDSLYCTLKETYQKYVLEGLSVLHFATANNRVDLVKQIIKNGGDVNKTFVIDYNPNYFYPGHDELAARCRGIGPSPFLVAVAQNNTYLVKCFLESGARINLEVNTVLFFDKLPKDVCLNRNALEIAIQLKKPKLAELLIDHGAKYPIRGTQPGNIVANYRKFLRKNVRNYSPEIFPLDQIDESKYGSDVRDDFENDEEENKSTWDDWDYGRGR
jgi:hypothetical protein